MVSILEINMAGHTKFVISSSHPHSIPGLLVVLETELAKRRCQCQRQSVTVTLHPLFVSGFVDLEATHFHLAQPFQPHVHGVGTQLLQAKHGPYPERNFKTVVTPIMFIEGHSRRRETELISPSKFCGLH